MFEEFVNFAPTNIDTLRIAPLKGIEGGASREPTYARSIVQAVERAFVTMEENMRRTFVSKFQKYNVSVAICVPEHDDFQAIRSGF